VLLIHFDAALCASSSSRKAGVRSTTRTPASVFDLTTRTVPIGKSTSRQQSATASPIRLKLESIVGGGDRWPEATPL
jgi:hypothetical protein